MKIGTCGQPPIENRPFKPVVAAGWRQRRMLGVEQEMDGMRGDHPVDQNHAEIQEVLDRMHRHAGPWARVHILVMEVVDALVERRPVDEAMNPVEVEFAPEGNEAQPDRAIDRVCSTATGNRDTTAPISARQTGGAARQRSAHSAPDRAAAIRPSRCESRIRVGPFREMAGVGA